MSEERMLCGPCGCALEQKRVDFEYLGHMFFADAPRCPLCGAVYLPEALVKGRVSEVEMELEDK